MEITKKLFNPTTANISSRIQNKTLWKSGNRDRCKNISATIFIRLEIFLFTNCTLLPRQKHALISSFYHSFLYLIKHKIDFWSLNNIYWGHRHIWGINSPVSIITSEQWFSATWDPRVRIKSQCMPRSFWVTITAKKSLLLWHGSDYKFKMLLLFLDSVVLLLSLNFKWFIHKYVLFWTCSNMAHNEGKLLARWCSCKWNTAKHMVDH